MTVRELKALLAHVPDETPIGFADEKQLLRLSHLSNYGAVRTVQERFAAMNTHDQQQYVVDRSYYSTLPCGRVLLASNIQSTMLFVCP